MDYDFTIIFKKLEEEKRQSEEVSSSAGLCGERDLIEAAEIAELRKIVLEVTEPDLNFYTAA